MSMASRMKQTADRLLRKYGEQSTGNNKPITFSYTTGRTRNIETGGFSEGSTINVYGYGYTRNYTAKEIDGSIIETTDIELICSSLSVVPQTDWKCTVDGNDYTVGLVKRVRVSGQDILYKVQLKV